ncbi:MAG TPA: MFS transporter [candidate division Zixibacteria bacterium]|nr:MFS transporter [candidate division Zixibacteria bacterium]
MPPKEEKLSLVGWLSFDFANTIFSMNIVTMFFNLWILDDLNCPDILYSISYSASMVMVALLMPFYGHYSDLQQNKKSWLIRFTLLSIISTVLIGLNAYIFEGRWTQIIIALIFFAAANFFYEGGIAFYNALLRSVSSRENIGRTSGLGVGLGYIGGIVGLLLVFPIVKGNIPWIPAGREAAIIPTAILFFIFSIPAFLLIREKTFEKIYEQRMKFMHAFNNLKDNLKQAREHKGAFRFLISNYFFEDAVVTAIIFMAIYAEKVVGFSDRLKIELWVVATLSAALGSIVSGRISDRIGPKRTMWIIVIGWIAVLLAISVITFQPLFWVAACFVGVFLGSTWTVARPLLNSLVPDEKLGLFYGLYALSGRTAAVIGPLIWGLVVLVMKAENPLVNVIVDLLNAVGVEISSLTLATIEYRFAVFSLALLMLIGLILFRKVPDRHRE